MMAFDENKYKSIFESRYGSGSYESGLANARKMGELKAQAAYAKKQYNSSTTSSGVKKKTYDDAISYWNDPTNKSALNAKGAYRTEEEIRNDPRKKQEIKDAGFNISDFIDGMYSAESNGEVRSKRESIQKYNKNQNVPKYDPEKPQSLIPMPKTAASGNQTSLLPQVKKKQTSKKKDESILTDVKNFFTSKDTNGDGQRDGLLGLADRYILPISQAADEVFLPGNEEQQIKNDKAQNKGKVKNPALKAGLVDRGTETKVLHGIGTALGYAAPYEGGYQAVGALNLLPKIANKVTNPYVQKAIRGGAAGLLAESGLAAENELVNPDANNASDYAKRIALGAAGGAIGDPLLHGLGNVAKKGIETASNRTMHNLLPHPNQVQQSLLDSANAFKAEQALPKQGGIQNPGMVQDLFPKGTNITKPNYLPELAPRTPQLNIPKVGNSIDQLPPLEEVSLMDRANMLNGSKRTMPDFSFGKQASEPNPPVNVYGAPIPYDKVDHAPADYWRSRYEEFVNYVNKNYDTNNLNKEALDELWTKFARNDEPVNLEQVVDLAYKQQPPVINTADVWNKMGNRPPATKQAQKILTGDFKSKQPPSLKDLVPNPRENTSQQLQDGLNTFRQAEQGPLSLNPSQLPVKPGTTDTIKPLQQSAPVKQPNERSFFNTVQNPEKLTPELQQRLDEFDKTYTPMSNQELVDHANKYVSKDMEKAYQFVKNARKFDARHVTVGHRLIDELQKAGEFGKALDVVERLAEQGTKAGQSIQSYSIYNRLSAEGQLLRAQRHVNRINQDIADPAKQVKLTAQHVEDISQTADSIQKFAGQMDQANNVMKIMDNVKKGKVATDSELETVRSFVSDAKKFFGDLAPNVTQPKVKSVKDVRTRDKVVDFMSKKEDVARKELQKIFGRANSLPVDAFYHLSVIGASKIAKGTVKLTDFTEEMAKEFGDTVRPYAKQIYNKAVETFNLQSESMTQKRLSEVEKIANKALKDKSLSGDEVDSIKEFARQVGAMSGDAKLEHSMELQSILQALERPTFGQKLSAAQTIAQLLNPKTVVRNALGNEMFYRVEQINKLLATPIDIARSKITGGERTITFVRNKQGQYWRNWLTGAKAGWKGVNPMGLQTQYDLGPQAFRAKWNPLTYLEKSLGATLRSFDHAGYMRAYNGTLEELAKLRAINEGLTGTAKTEAIQRYMRESDENALQIADEYGKYATFQDNTTLSTALTKVKKGMNKVSTFGATENFGLGDLVLKYPKTPGNLVMRAIEYSPAGVIRSMHLLKDMATKNPKATREFYLSLSRAIMGTGGFSVLGYALANKGILTSAGNSDYEVASLEKSAGKQPNSVNITALKRFITSGFDLDHAETQEGDTFVSYDWAQPISIAIALGTGVNQSVKENGKLTPTGAAKGAFDSGINTVVNQSVLKGVSDFLANYPGRTMSDRVGDAAKGALGSFVPSLSNQARQLNDNTARTTYSPNLLPEIKNRAINRLPGAEKSLPPAYDTLGNKRQTYQNDGNGLFNVLLNPSFVSKYKPSPEAKMVLDVINATGDKTLAPRMAQKKIDGQPLTTEQYAEYQRIMGEQVQRRLAQLSPNGNNEALSKAIDKILRDAGRTARTQIRQEMGD
jgi:hypothetical protein